MILQFRGYLSVIKNATAFVNHVTAKDWTVGSHGRATINRIESCPACRRMEATCSAPIPQSRTSPTAKRWSPFSRFPSCSDNRVSDVCYIIHPIRFMVLALYHVCTFNDLRLPYQQLLRGIYFLQQHRCCDYHWSRNRTRSHHWSKRSLEFAPIRTEANFSCM